MTHILKVFFVLGGLCATMAIATSCTQQRDEVQPPAGPHASSEFVLVVLKTLENPYFVEMQKGIEEAARNSSIVHEVRIRSGSAEGDARGQRQVLETMYREYVRDLTKPGISAVILTPGSSGSALVPAIKLFRDRDVPVILVDTNISVDALVAGATNVTSFIGSSNVEGGRQAGQILLETMVDGDRILLLNGLDGHETAAARREGFLKAIEGSTTQIEIVERTCDWERPLARRTLQALLGAGEKFDGVFAANDQMALGAIEALRQGGAEDTIVVGFDAIPDARDAVDDGRMLATIMQRPASMGATAIKTVEDVLAGKGVQQIIPVEAYR